MDATVKVFNCSELLATLLKMLEPLSVTRLAQSGLVHKEVFERSLSANIWEIMIKRKPDVGGDVLLLDDVKNLVAILKFSQTKDHMAFLLPLLIRICETYEVAWNFVEINIAGEAYPRRVSRDGFILLEEAEGSFGTNIHKIDKLELASVGDTDLGKLRRKIMQQLHPVASINFREVILGGGLQSLKDFIFILQSCIILKHRIREDINRKKTFSFGHCPNNLTPPPDPIRATWSFFSDVKIPDLKVT